MLDVNKTKKLINKIIDKTNTRALADVVYHGIYGQNTEESKYSITNNNLAIENNLPSFDLRGLNWEKSNDSKKIAVLWGFNPWKRDFVSSFLSDYKVAFSRGKTKWAVQESELKKHSNLVFVFWGGTKWPEIENYANSQGIEIFRMEDGFLRSIGLGASHITPLSLVLDKKGIYFNKNQESDLEILLNNYDFASDPQLIKRAKACLERIKELKLSKYNFKGIERSDNDNNEAFPQKQILVLGQVDSDASIALGTEKKIQSNELVQIAAKENPEAKIIYKPHPEVLAGYKKQQNSPEEVSEIATILDESVSLHDALEGIDHVYTITSLAGFEAILRDIPVTTFGAPFYSGWGLTEDRLQITRRKRDLTKEELFAAAYILYPLYRCPITGEPIVIEQAIQLLELMKDDYFSLYFEIHSYFSDGISKGLERYYQASNVDSVFESTFKGSLTEYNKNYLFGNYFDAIRNEKSPIDVLLLMEGKLSLELMIIVYTCTLKFLMLRFRYNFLASVLQQFIKFYDRNVCQINFSKQQEILELLHHLMKSLNGRKIKEAPRISEELLLKENWNAEERDTLLLGLRLICLNCEYSYLQKILYRVSSASSAFWIRVCAYLKEKPVVSERDGFFRHKLLTETANKYRSIDGSFSDGYSIIRNILYFELLGDVNTVTELVRDFTKLVSEKDLIPVFFKTDAKHQDGTPKCFSELLKIVNFLFINNEDVLATQLIKTIKTSISQEKFDLFIAKQLSKFNKHHELQSLISTRSYHEKEAFMMLLSDSLRQRGMFGEAINAIKKSTSVGSSIKRSIRNEKLKRLEFLAKTTEIINSYPQPIIPKGVVYLCSLGCLDSLALIAPVLLELKKQGYIVHSLTQGMLQKQSSTLSAVDAFSDMINHQYSDGKLELTWQVDWSNRIVECQGINFYQGIYERLSTTFRRLSIDIEEPAVAKIFYVNLLRSDYLLRVCMGIFQTVTNTGIPSIMLGANSHVSPYSIIRDFCLHKRNDNFRFALFNIAYENYYSNLGKYYSQSMSVVDMTLHRNCRQPFFAIKERFEKWFECSGSSAEVQHQVELQLKTDRSGKSQVTKHTLEVIEAAKKENRKIICCFGKVLCDVGVPFEGGAGHQDMADWINHTVEVAQSNPSILVIIKPHPHELRPEVALDLTEKLRDLLPEKLPQNVLYLNHNEFNVHEIADVIDLAVLWNGTSGVELTAQGVPVIMCSYFAQHDYPVELIYPTSRDNYEELLVAKELKEVPYTKREKAAALIYYMGTKEVCLPNSYTYRRVTNDKIGAPRWNNDMIANYFESGDKYVTLAANRITEYFRIK